MKLDDVLASLFPSGHQVERGPSGTLHGTAKVDGQADLTVVGIVGGTPLGVDGAILLAGHVLAAVGAGGRAPIVVLVDTASQNMARRDELLGLNEYLAHLNKSSGARGGARPSHGERPLRSCRCRRVHRCRAVEPVTGGAAGCGVQRDGSSLHVSSHQAAARAAPGASKVDPHICARRRPALRGRRGGGDLDSGPAIRPTSCSPAAAARAHLRPTRPDRARTQRAPLGPKDRQASCCGGCRGECPRQRCRRAGPRGDCSTCVRGDRYRAFPGDGTISCVWRRTSGRRHWAVIRYRQICHCSRTGRIGDGR